MQWTGLNDLREKYLSFFESKGHLRLPSFPLIPKDDNSLLLINSGMAPMKTWFTREEEPPRNRVTTCQKCIRTGDIENIGKTWVSRHATVHSSRCLATSPLAITSKRKRLPGLGSSLQRFSRCRQIDFISPFIRTTMKRLTSGQSKTA